jgi:hypothetical protein
MANQDYFEAAEIDKPADDDVLGRGLEDEDSVTDDEDDFIDDEDDEDEEEDDDED